ncbi:MAG: M48 family metallopeptidase [Caulobacteraceae bacterium]|nr:M48 family metallopeptidase [Caulobacteraceae bacterium]
MSLFKFSYADGQLLQIEGVKVRLRVSPRARRITLRVDRATGEATAVAPSRSALREAARFASERRAWLRAQLEDVPPPAPALIADGRLEVLGQVWRLQPDGRRPLLTQPGLDGIRQLRGCGEAEVDPMIVARVVRREAKTAFAASALVHCAALGVERPPIGLMDARTRWGSCTPAQKGRGASIRLSWRLALAPWAVADYVVAHECAHLLEGNHGPRFWAHVRTLVGDPAPHRRWLRAEGARLHGLLATPRA